VLAVRSKGAKVARADRVERDQFGTSSLVKVYAASDLVNTIRIGKFRAITLRTFRLLWSVQIELDVSRGNSSVLPRLDAVAERQWHLPRSSKPPTEQIAPATERRGLSRCPSYQRWFTEARTPALPGRKTGCEIEGMARADTLAETITWTCGELDALLSGETRHPRNRYGHLLKSALVGPRHPTDAGYPAAAASELATIHRLSNVAFARNPFFTPIDIDAFSALYAPVLPRIVPELVLIAEDRAGETLGFLFGMPNLAEGAAPQTAILKTYASLRPRVGSVLSEAFHAAAERLGFRRVIHALMHDDNLSLQHSGRIGSRVFRRYVLLGRRTDAG
jgi:hypothetical protein